MHCCAVHNLSNAIAVPHTDMSLLIRCKANATFEKLLVTDAHPLRPVQQLMAAGKQTELLLQAARCPCERSLRNCNRQRLLALAAAVTLWVADSVQLHWLPAACVVLASTRTLRLRGIAGVNAFCRQQQQESVRQVTPWTGECGAQRGATWQPRH